MFSLATVLLEYPMPATHRPILIFFHCCFEVDGVLLPHAMDIVSEQMRAFNESGLTEAASEFHVGMNAGDEGVAFSGLFPDKAIITYHGTRCHNELRTIMMIEDRVKQLKSGTNILYVHSKGASRPTRTKLIESWRECMMNNLVWNWKLCSDLMAKGYESCGCHWLTGQVDGTQNLWGGNFWWARSEFISTLPAIASVPRLAKMGGLDEYESRFEAEIWIGNGPRVPRVKDFHMGWPTEHE